jgi:hypothetical protein
VFFGKVSFLRKKRISFWTDVLRVGDSAGEMLSKHALFSWNVFPEKKFPEMPYFVFGARNGNEREGGKIQDDASTKGLAGQSLTSSFCRNTF